MSKSRAYLKKLEYIPELREIRVSWSNDRHQAISLVEPIPSLGISSEQVVRMLEDLSQILLDEQHSENI